MESVDNAEALFKSLREGLAGRVQELITRDAPETLYLDFKAKSDPSDGTGLDRPDRENLAKALSGFANAAGGVLLWGVAEHREGTARRLHPEPIVGLTAGDGCLDRENLIFCPHAEGAVS